ncbi:MAG: hypothetical protein CM1200mP9_10760 [Gammaproteobacteria bacterium]|nr:MAG: hypothetical protein CM1200mP9_10760 [Gammaproteobacteria bacterium]
MGFREEARDWLEHNCPKSMRTPTPGANTLAGADAKNTSIPIQDSGWIEWQSGLDCTYLADGVWRGRSHQRRKSRPHRRNASHQARSPLGGHGLTMIGPAILEFGTHEQCLNICPESSAAKSMVPGLQRTRRRF